MLHRHNKSVRSHSASKRGQPVRKRPGRPEGTSKSQERILERASILFARHGYAGTSLREIAEKTGVTTALVTYYFGSKERLLKTIMLAHGLELAQERLKRLRGLRSKTATPSVREIVAALVTPLALKMPVAQRILKIQAWLFLEPIKFATMLRHELYDDTNREFISALQSALPHLSLRTVQWRYLLSVGAYLYLSDSPQRFRELTGGSQETLNIDEYVEQVSDFICGGVVGAQKRVLSASDVHPAPRI